MTEPQPSTQAKQEPKELERDADHEARALAAIRSAARSVPFYVKQAGFSELAQHDGSLAEVLAKLPLLTRDRIRPTLPKQWFPEGRDAKAELASGAVTVIEVGVAESRVRALFSSSWWRAQERRALAIHPRARSAYRGEIGSFRDAVLWVPERGTGSCGSGDPSYEERLEGVRLHLNSRQDPTFWTEPVMTRMLDEVSVHETTALFADPFYLDVLARHAAILNRRLDVIGFVATTRARATAAHRAALARVYPGTVIDVLGAREVGTLFVGSDDGKMHHAPFTTHVELLPAKVETPGAKDLALVVVTTIARDVQPLVRYVLGDLVQVAAGEASRYTTVPPITSVEGTIDDALIRPDGAIVTAGAIDRALDVAPRGYQVTQTSPTEVEIELIGGAPAAAEEALAPLLAGMRVSARNVTAIGAEPNGKYRTSKRRNVPLSLSAVFEKCD